MTTIRIHQRDTYLASSALGRQLFRLCRRCGIDLKDARKETLVCRDCLSHATRDGWFENARTRVRTP